MPTATIIGAGVIGVSFARLFANAGWQVRLNDPRPDLQQIVERDLAGLPVTGFSNLAEAATGADFVQEAGPERVPLKKQIFATLAASTRDDVVLASSTSSLLPSSFSEGNPAADRIVVAHPFNPPELIPLVEIVPSPATSQETVDRTYNVFLELGKLPIKLKKEIPGFVGNRLQRALNEQASYLVQQGVIGPGELDEMVKASLGLRWATIGPFESRTLGGGPGGMRHIIEHIGPAMTFDLGTPDKDAMGPVCDAVEAVYGTGQANWERLSERRDRRTRAVLDALEAADEKTIAEEC
ncbi:hydroxylacyl-CoA dehydrogenase [Tsukamurella asaccharolytica]|uniref:Hydroxylacyl-CoA dehydrogenase n=1 Tax=Tsukamurella asaccharolytica TaxID=2592067 RepID=A0A5C5RBH5_9ACTN|nr:3-hydroxyacyl-CoA dehydrogenase NAD-binding domain-containing protein [Tsukamurella asaccharolytica]TWS20118.1 hydroxylacyl-CoA dehydrogenase [Tsukamurella asaccharolytica]